MQRAITAATAALILILSIACAKTESTTDTASTDTAATQTTVTSPAGEASAPPPDTVTPGDREFAEKAARTGMAEVQLATNVTQRATSPDVKAFARKMIEDHNRSNQELTTLAARKGLDPPADLDPEKKALDAELAKLTGPALDKAYMEAMVKDHVNAATEFESASRQLADPDLKAWAAKTLPVLHEHHHLAEQIVAKLK
jgi:putative membrane protein